ncbi:hypothetical protein KCU62_g3294, partial [Aureobasidium sp. EXF-3399]
GHSQLKTGHPVRSAIHKQLNGRLVLRWVTTWESLLLYVLQPFCSFHLHCLLATMAQYRVKKSSILISEIRDESCVSHFTTRRS